MIRVGVVKLFDGRRMVEQVPDFGASQIRVSIHRECVVEMAVFVDSGGDRKLLWLAPGDGPSMSCLAGDAVTFNVRRYPGEM